MYPPSIERENVLARQNEILQTADNYLRAKQLQQRDQLRPSYLARISNFLASVANKYEFGTVADPNVKTSWQGENHSRALRNDG